MSTDNTIPGLESFTNKEEEFLFDGEKKQTYFDASELPDGAGYQANASGALTYSLYLIFPSREDQLRALSALTKGYRKNLAAGSRIASINAVAIMKEDAQSRTYLEMWEDELLGVKPKSKKDIDTDEAQEPI